MLAKRGDAVVVGEADRDADGEEQRQIGKDRAAGCGHDLRDELCGSHEKFALPTPSRMPATGSTETGSIMHLPIFWRKEKALEKYGHWYWRWLGFGFGKERADFVARAAVSARCASSWQSSRRGVGPALSSSGSTAG